MSSSHEPSKRISYLEKKNVIVTLLSIWMAFTWKADVKTSGHGEPPFFGLGLSQDLVLDVIPVL